MSKKFYIRFTVQGKGHFPHDMLRYDRCWPYESKDVSAMGFYEDGMVREVELVFIGRKTDAPTVARWLSFGWRVTLHAPLREVE